MKHSPASLRKLATKFGCYLDISLDGSSWTIILDAPPGKIFRGQDFHYTCALHGHDFLKDCVDWNKTATDIERIATEGFEDCKDEDCEWCNS